MRSLNSLTSLYLSFPLSLSLLLMILLPFSRQGNSYRGFGSLPQSNSISKSDSLTANSNIYDYDYYDDDTYEKQDKHDENFLLKALKYLRGDYEMKRIDDYSDYYYDDGYGINNK